MSKLTAADRKSIPAEDFAEPPDGFPIVDQDHLDAAVRMLKDATDPAATKKRIVAIAKRKGLKLPTTWEGAASDMVKRSGKLFEVGKQFTDKNGVVFGYDSDEEADNAIAQFTPQPLNLQHLHNLKIPTIFDGIMGTATRMYRKGRDIIADYEIPQWLHSATGGNPIPVSAEFNFQTKKPGSIALVVEGAVADAVMMSAAVEFAKRHDTAKGQAAMQEMHDHAVSRGAVCKQANAQMASAHEASAIQAIHDTTVTHGATCDAIPADSARTMQRAVYYAAASIDAAEPADTLQFQPPQIPATGGDSRQENKMPETTKPKSFWQNVAAFLSGTDTPVTEDEAKAEFAKLAPPVAADPQVVQLEKRVADLTSKDRKVEAVQFADRMVREGRIMPSERAAIVAQHEQNALDDAQYPAAVQFAAPGADGKSATATGTRVQSFEQLISSRVAHTLTAEVLKEHIANESLSLADLQVMMSKTTTDDPSAAKPMDEETRKKYMNMTPVGRQALTTKKEN